jgi:periplasmic protein TonB
MDKNKYAPKDYERKATQNFLTFVLGLVLLGGLVLYLFMPTESKQINNFPPEEDAILAVNEEKSEDPIPSEDEEYKALKDEKPTDKTIKTPKEEVKKEEIKKDKLAKEAMPKKTGIDETQALVLVDEMATPKSGFEVFYRYIRDNMAYPEEAIKQGIEGKVVLEFIVDKEGNLHNMRVKKGLGHGCDEAAMRVVKEGEKWKPAKNKGEIVLQKITLPISFKLSK